MTTPRYVIEFPESVRLTREAREKVAAELAGWVEGSDMPLVLAQGGRIRSILPDGTITPADPPASELVTLESTTIAWPILVLTGALGAISALVALLVLTALM